MRRLAAWLALALSAAMPALAAPPDLVVYVTDENKDVYVALYGHDAVELAGCPNETAARALLALPAGAARQTTLGELQGAHDLVTPKIPCSADAHFDADFPATAPVWFDAAGSPLYYLSAPSPQGTFYVIPSRCTAIKEAFAMRQRIALPGVLQGQAPPPAGSIAREIILDCGDGQATPSNPEDGGNASAGDHWSLHRTDVFLSEASIGDTVYVAVYSHVTAAGAEKSYLPIYRINGAPAGQALWEGSSRRETVETALKALFGIDAQQPVTTLGAEDVAKLNPAPYVDLCLTGCAGYQFQHAFFPQPGQLFDLVTLPAPSVSQRLSLLGETLLRWDFGHDRAVSFTGCDRLMAAMGIASSASASQWGDLMDAAMADQGSADRPFVCAPTGPDLCLRSVADGGVLTQALFARGGDCPTARRLRIQLPVQARITNSLVLDARGFTDIEIAPRDPLGRSQLTASPAQAGAAAASLCPFEPAPSILYARDLAGLRIERVDLVRSTEGTAEELTAMILENTRVALDHVAIGAVVEGRRPIERTIRLCNAELYALGGSFESSLLGLHGLNAHISVAGSGAADPSTIKAGSFGLFLMSSSVARLAWTTLSAPRAILLRASELKGIRVDLSAPEPTSPSSSGLRLERGASASLSVSSARRFACLAVFLDASASARFTLPTNDLAADNQRTACGPGVVDILD